MHLLFVKKQKIYRTYKFRLYPTKLQEEKLERAIEKCRFVYNIMLKEIKENEVQNKYLLQNSLPKLKEKYPRLKEVYSKTLQYEVHRLFMNLNSCKNKNRLRYKTKLSFRTIHYNQSGFKVIFTSTRLNRLHLSKIGDIPIRLHRDVVNKIKQITIKRYNSNKWFACFFIEIDKKFGNQIIKNYVGIDLGIKYFLSDSDGRQIENPQYFNKTMKQLRRNQKLLSKTREHSKNRIKKQVKVAKKHEKITNQRKDFLHKLSKYYASIYDFIVVEDLNIDNMIRNHFLSRSISDVSWYRFTQMLSYKAESAGKIVIKVNPRGTSKIHKYGKIDKDYNASLNILERGLNKVGKGQTEFTPVDIKPLQKLNLISASQVVESGSLNPK